MRIRLLILLILLSCVLIAKEKNEFIIDSDMTFEQAIKGTQAPKDVIDSLCLLDVRYYSFDGKLHKGQLVINKNVKDDVEEVFSLILKSRFPVNKVVPIVRYNWSDDASMSDNNTSAFCYRFVANTERLSNHAFGCAIDINPGKNPVIYSDGSISPKGAVYDINKPGTFSANHPVVKAFLSRGWRWGGNFITFKDNHHFDKK